MKISVTWLRELVDLPKEIGWQEIARRLTFAGLEVESASHVGAGLSGAIIAEVRGRRPHPKADKLTLVDVFDGQTVTQVVCGAPNVPAPGRGPGEDGKPGSPAYVVWARPGARLPNGLVLSTREVRGVPSPGMLCAEDELGLSEDHGGILVLSEDDGLAVGNDFAAGAGLPDTVLELNVTPNRADCLGHVGVAREVAALFPEARLTLPAPDLTPYLAPRGEAFSVEILEAEGCPRYTARALYGVRVRKSPLWLRLRLLRLGVRAISNVVDATNMAMLEWGQPLHAFDLRRLRGRIVVRRGFEGETLLTLDGNARALQGDDLLIADSAEPGSGVAIAGVMGGRESEVSDQTTDLLLESAYFTPSWVRRTARRLRLHSEASHRFERGVDPTVGVAAASLRCAQLIVQLGGGQVTVDPVLHDACPRPIEPAAVTLRPARTRLLLGREMPAAEQAALLRALGLGVEERGAEEALQVRVPTARGDLTREADLIEEIARLSGYEGIPARLPPFSLQAAEALAGARRPEVVADRARDLCVSLGLTEIITFSFGSPERLRLLGCPEADRRARPLLLHNPLREELSALRTQLLPGLLEALRVHLSRGQRDVRLFEVGEVFLRAGRGPEAGDLPDEHTRVAGVLAGCRDHWLKEQKGDELDFFDVRGVVDALLAALGCGAPGDGAGAPRLRAAAPGEVPWLHPGVAAVVEVMEGDRPRVIGELGEIHPDLRRRLGIEARAFAFEVELPQAPAARPVFAPLPRFPEVTRDLSFFVDAAVPAGQVLALLRGGGQALLTDVRVVEDYREAGRVPAGKKGLLLSLTYRSPERTLTDEEVQRAHDGLIAHLRGALTIELR